MTPNSKASLADSLYVDVDRVIGQVCTDRPEAGRAALFIVGTGRSNTASLLSHALGREVDGSLDRDAIVGLLREHAEQVACSPEDLVRLETGRAKSTIDTLGRDTLPDEIFEIALRETEERQTTGAWPSEGIDWEPGRSIFSWLESHRGEILKKITAELDRAAQDPAILEVGRTCGLSARIKIHEYGDVHFRLSGGSMDAVEIRLGNWKSSESAAA